MQTVDIYFITAMASIFLIAALVIAYSLMQGDSDD